MPLDWSEIRARAVAFSKEWADAKDEDADAKSFWDDFFEVFGVPRRRVASFERPVKRADGSTGYIDLLWKGMILVEHKSRGKDLDRAFKQAKNYFPGLDDAELPRLVVVSDFARVRVYDMESRIGQGTLFDTDQGIVPVEFPLSELHKNVELFGIVAGHRQHLPKAEDPINVKAVESLGKLHDELAKTGYQGHPLEQLLVRLLFCMFAEDTGIFERWQFQDFVEDHTRDDGSDLSARLMELFYWLNQPEATRPPSLPDNLSAFPYVNGRLFLESLPPATFTKAMRDALLHCCRLDWSRISPAIFGSLFQSVMDKDRRRALGAHYTTEKNILKLIRPLFLDDLRAEFDRVKTNRAKLDAFHRKLAGLKFLDPACGCGNFLVVAYRELRLLEMDILHILLKNSVFSGRELEEQTLLNVDQFYGIELEEFPARIAEVALWLTDHQMNVAFSEEFGQYFRRLPLKKAATIVNGNALRLDWGSLFVVGEGRAISPQRHKGTKEEMSVPPQTPDAAVGAADAALRRGNRDLPVGAAPSPRTSKAIGAAMKHAGDLPQRAQSGGHRERRESQGEAAQGPDYILGNPPFVGHQWRTPEQMEDMAKIWGESGRFGRLDYVTCWYRVAAEYIVRHPQVRCAFVSTNSITQGEQVGILWPELLRRGVKIQFAHRTFQWSSEARGKAAVHVVIIGFGAEDVPRKLIFDYATPQADPVVSEVRRINPYLIDADDVVLPSRTSAPPGMPKLLKGSQPTDGGHLLLEESEKDELLRVEPAASKWLRRYLGGEELLYDRSRWCLWLKEAPPADIRKMPSVMSRLERVAEARRKSPTASVREFAEKPALFTQDRQPSTNYLGVPEVSSENRRFLPIAFLSKDIIASSKLQIVPGATKYHFGVLSSTMHNAWIRYTAGRLESRYSYSPSVYNNFPWPETPSVKAKAAIEAAAQSVLDARAAHPGSSLADLYDPLTMPGDLLKAHHTLDRAVDSAYGSKKFASDADRVAFLLDRYQTLLAPLTAASKRPRKQGKS